MRKFEDWTLAHLQRFFPRQCARAGEPQLRKWVRHGVRRASIYGITAKKDVCKYIDVMMVLGPDFDADPKFPWAPGILAGSGSPDARMRALLQAAQNHLKQT